MGSSFFVCLGTFVAETSPLGGRYILLALGETVHLFVIDGRILLSTKIARIYHLSRNIPDEPKKSEAWINHASLLGLAPLRALETSYGSVWVLRYRVGGLRMVGKIQANFLTIFGGPKPDRPIDHFED